MFILLYDGFLKQAHILMHVSLTYESHHVASPTFYGDGTDTFEHNSPRHLLRTKQ